MFSQIIFRVRYWLHAQCSIRKYDVRFRRMSDAELRTVVSRERSVRGWCSERSYYLHALRAECSRRGVEYCW